ncbi:MAG: DUF1653 domain-containing protein [Clostridia bacterium]|nr:DUF1653 domain-containing protein [Clostridia bacterium]
MTYEEAVRAIPPGRYRHFKGKLYEVVGIARHSETDEPMVVYRALYGKGDLWVRPAEMWNETVERDGKTYRRFYRLDRIERVERYERLFNDDSDLSPMENLSLLEAYYTSGEWQEDYEADKRGELPPDLERYVLSQDVMNDLPGVIELFRDCRKWTEGDPILEEYHDHEWCKINHDDDYQFMMLCLGGASAGLSWSVILHRREAYRAAFHDFRIDACAKMTDEELEAQLMNLDIIRNRGQIYSVRKNAQVVQQIQKEFGSFDAYLWSFTDGKQIDRHWKTRDEIPAASYVSRRMSRDMKKRGITHVGPCITYSLLQAIGIVNDHLADCAYR